MCMVCERGGENERKGREISDRRERSSEAEILKRWGQRLNAHLYYYYTMQKSRINPF